ncbi:MAG: cytochrome c [Bacteroidota bacterium]
MKAVKIILLAVGIIVVVVFLVLGYVRFFMPDVAAVEMKVEITPERVQRGDYLANHVMVCMDCHSVRDWALYSGPVTPGTLGAGGDEFTREMGFPGDFYAPNVTPYHLGDWSDGEIYRAITSGVDKDGNPLFPVMPYHSYGKADKEDIFSVIAYIRSLDPIAKDVPESDPDFPFSLIMRMIPQEADHQTRPPTTNTIEYGEYLATVAACADCHTPFEKGQPVTDLLYAGGREFELPFGTLRGPNITPDMATGIGAWTEDVFVNRFKSYDSIHKLDKVNAPMEFNTLMPWNMYGGMKEEDLRAIYAYLRSLDPVEHEVEKVTYRDRSAKSE